MTTPTPSALGFEPAPGQEPALTQAEILGAICAPRVPVYVVAERGGAKRRGVALKGSVVPGDRGAYELIALLPAIYPEWLGDRSFHEVHGTRFAYVAGAMANGIATVELVEAMARAEMLAFFGAAGLGFERVEAAIAALSSSLGDRAPWGANLIHSPAEPSLEERVAALYIERGVRRVSASAYMALTPSIVRYAYAGTRVGADGRLERPHHVFAKVSRVETATHFLEPAPGAMLRGLVERGWLTSEEAGLAEHLPVAEDITAEADSGGHTDNRPLPALLPELMALRDRIAAARGYDRPLRVGAAGGLGTPAAVAGALAHGAAYVLTGSINQAALEAGLSAKAKAALCSVGMADVAMAPAADMFELGVDVQVAKRGTMFASRAAKLYQVWRAYPGLDAIPQEERTSLERRTLGAPIDRIWGECERFWSRRDPAELERASREPKHKMALVFRWYLGMSSRWAIEGTEGREMDYQVWCGPAMGAFNTWARKSFLEHPEGRDVVSIALNLIEGAAHIQRAGALRAAGVPVPAAAFDFRPRPLRLA